MVIVSQNKAKHLIFLLPLAFAAAILPHKLSAGEKAVYFKTIQDIPSQKWADLSNKNIYFGHQSVGYNIIAGLQDVLQHQPGIKLNIIETENVQSQSLSIPFFAHSRIGVNQDPKSKIDVFVDLMDKGMAQKADIAFFKFCYVDIHQGTHIEELFTYYKTSLKRLSDKYPGTIFIHVTAPLTSQQTGVKAIIKKIIGKPLRGDNNKYREQFNKLMRTEYAGEESLFDLALLESSTPDNSETGLALHPSFTEDGGHLNKLGGKTIAEQLLIFLASL